MSNEYEGMKVQIDPITLLDAYLERDSELQEAKARVKLLEDALSKIRDYDNCGDECSVEMAKIAKAALEGDEE